MIFLRPHGHPAAGKAVGVKQTPFHQTHGQIFLIEPCGPTCRNLSVPNRHGLLFWNQISPVNFLPLSAKLILMLGKAGRSFISTHLKSSMTNKNGTHPLYGRSLATPHLSSNMKKFAEQKMELEGVDGGLAGRKWFVCLQIPVWRLQTRYLGALPPSIW